MKEIFLQYFFLFEILLSQDNIVVLQNTNKHKKKEILEMFTKVLLNF